jgi:hypothetical protein
LVVLVVRVPPGLITALNCSLLLYWYLDCWYPRHFICPCDEHY